MNKRLYIVTGKIQSGKTTRLFEFIKNKNSVDGLLAPIVNGKRKLFHISSKELKDLEVAYSDNSTISVGKYHFLKETFNWGNAKLIESYSKKPEWLIIDEVGKLELAKKGLEPAITEILQSLTRNKTKIILVIRDYLVDEVLQKYNLTKQDIERLKV
jgi:nucleoside-triphosphatase THEP1